MKVLHAVQSYLPISENWIYPQIMRVAGVQPAVLCSERSNLELFPLNGAPCVQDPPPWSAGLGVPRLLNTLSYRLGHGAVVARAAVRRWRPDLIHAHFGMRGWELLHLRRELGVPLITSFYGMDAWQLPTGSQLWRKRFVELFREGDRFLAEGPAMGRRLEAIGCPPERIQVVRLGVESAALPFDAKTFATPLRVLMMARFVEKKGLPLGLRACAEAVRQGTDLQVTIIGAPGNDNPAGELIGQELRALAETEPLCGRVTFPGFLKPAEARVLLHASDIFLCPSQHASDGDAEGGSPLALTEAMALGLLCIGTRHCDIPEVIQHRQTGLLADEGDLAGLAAMLAEAARQPEASRAQCLQGRRHIEERFSCTQQVEALAKVYRELASP